LIGSGGGAHDLAELPEVHAGLSLKTAAAYQKVEIPPLDPERRRNQRAGRVIATVEAVNQALPLKAVHGHLARQRAMGGHLAKGLAGGFPCAIVRPLEIGNEDVVRRERRATRQP